MFLSLSYLFRLCSEVSNKAASSMSRLSLGGSSSNVTEGIRVVSRSPLKKDLVSHPLLHGITFLAFFNLSLAMFHKISHLHVHFLLQTNLTILEINSVNLEVSKLA